ncbi:hypothetical protein [Bacteroides acidifaciens]|uniref:hypothetical protein n=1 Tax=Bacteroides acidifaciens TaxID=85831 RepID=UPI0026EF80DC|nr:hypothetical protein [Bacteroides acidifaciens]
MEVVIRTMEQIDSMGETGKAIKEIAGHNLFKPKYPLIYQFKKGVPGESMSHDERDVIGDVSDVRLTSEGLIGNVNITIVAANAVHFDGTVDNFVISKTLGAPVLYELKHFVVYNKKAKEIANREKEYEDNTVKKLYNAPKEVIDINPEDGDVLANNIKSWNKTLQDVINENTKIRR